MSDAPEIGSPEIDSPEIDSPEIDSHEIELKFLCPPGQLDAVLSAAPEGQEDVKQLASVYFDTPDLILQKAGASLRVRESKGRRVQTLKQGAGFRRREHEAEIAGDRPDPKLGPLPELLPNGHALALQPAFDVQVTRRQRLIRYAGAEIELAVDEGEVRAGGAKSPISEVELELKAGDPGALFGLARELNRAAPLFLSFDTKSDRGQALVAGEALVARRGDRLALAPDATAAGAFQAIARNALARIAANAVVLRERPAPEALHQLRVAARTLRSAFSTFRSLFGDEDAERLKAELRWLAKACDAARNLDVFAQETIAAARELETPPHGLEALAHAVEAARAAATEAAAQAVGSERFRALMIDAAAWVETGAWLARAEGRPEPAAGFARRALDKRLKRLLKRGRRLEKLDDEGRHRVRIEGKKLRYAAEAFASLYPEKKAQRFVARVKALQEELGALNDLATAESLIEGLHLPPEAAFAAGELVGLKAAHKGERIAAAAKALHHLAETEPFWR